eukprot:m51a1_g7944 hypothetical protein (251) ;mRNA; r:118265-119099
MVLVEVCVDSVQSALCAARGGAARLELCSSLFTGGLTPSAGLLRRVRALVPRDVALLHVLVRPRPGDFVYAPDDVAVMLDDIALARDAGADGVVVGALTPAGDVDVALAARLVAAARPLSVTFHRAFDLTRDARRALDDVMATGADRVLTSGLERSALEGVWAIRELVQRAQGRIGILAGGGVTERNVGRLVAETGVREVHMSAGKWVQSAAEHRPGHVGLGGSLALPDFSLKVCDEDTVASVVSQVASL